MSKKRIFIACCMAALPLFAATSCDEKKLTPEWTVTGPAKGTTLNRSIMDREQNVILALLGEYESDQQGTLVKINRGGATLWSVDLPMQCFDATTDAANNIYTVGALKGYTNTDPQVGIAKVAPDGTTLWMNLDPGLGFFPYHIRLDAAGNIFIAGSNEYTWNVAKVDPAGTLLWEREIPLTGTTGDVYNRYRAIAVDAAGDVYVAGTHHTDYSLVKLGGADGAKRWEATCNGPANGNDELFGLALDSRGNPVVTGSTSKSGTSQTITTIKYSPAGAQLWKHVYEHKGICIGSVATPAGIALDAADNVVVVGGIQVITGGVPVPVLPGVLPIGNSYAFAMKLNPAGAQQWFTKGETGGLDVIVIGSLFIGADNSIYTFGMKTFYRIDAAGKAVWQQKTDILGGGYHNVLADAEKKIYWTNGWLSSYEVTKYRE